MVHLIGFTIEIYYDARLCERKMYMYGRGIHVW